MSKFNVSRLVHEAMIAAAGRDNPIVVWPSIAPSGKLVWIVQDAVRTAVIDTETGEVQGRSLSESNEAFDAVVGALKEWYVVDRDSYGGENILKVKDEIQ